MWRRSTERFRGLGLPSVRVPGAPTKREKESKGEVVMNPLEYLITQWDLLWEIFGFWLIVLLVVVFWGLVFLYLKYSGD